MDQYFYLGKSQLAISDVLAIDAKIRESKTIQLIEGPVQFEFGIKSFVPLNWDHFTSFTHYLIDAGFNELGPRSIERLVTIFRELKGLNKTNIWAKICYHAKGLKPPTKSDRNEILIEWSRGRMGVGFSFQKASPYTKYRDGVLVKENKLDKFYDFIQELSGYPFSENTTNKLFLQPSELEHEFVQKAYDHLGQKITSISWSVGIFGKTDEILAQLQYLFNEKPDADWYKASITATLKSFLALEEFRKVIDHKTNAIVPLGIWILKEDKKNPEGLMPLIRVMEKGYQFLVRCEQPIHEGAKITPEMQGYMDLMGIDTTKATTFKKIQEEVHPQ